MSAIETSNENVTGVLPGQPQEGTEGKEALPKTVEGDRGEQGGDGHDTHSNGSEKEDGPTRPPPTKKTFLDVILEESTDTQFGFDFPEPIPLRREDTSSYFGNGMKRSKSLSLLPDPDVPIRSRRIQRRNATHYTPPDELGSPFDDHVIQDTENKPLTCLEKTMMKPFALGWRRIDVLVDILVMVMVVFPMPLWIAVVIIGCVRGPKAKEYFETNLI